MSRKKAKSKTRKNLQTGQESKTIKPNKISQVKDSVEQNNLNENEKLRLKYELERQKEEERIAKAVDKYLQKHHSFQDSDLSELESSGDIIRKHQSAIQQSLAGVTVRESHKIPLFLIDESRWQERTEQIGKLKTLMSMGFSLVETADILENNDYDSLEEVLNQREKLFTTVWEYCGDDFLLNFQEKVGNDAADIYTAQANRMTKALNRISNGKHFGKKNITSEMALQDIISNVVDTPEFNLACQIETTFMQSELDKAIAVILDLGKRVELAGFVCELRELSEKVSSRKKGYDIISEMINGKGKGFKIDIDDQR